MFGANNLLTVTAASGLALSTAPDMNRFFPFLRPLLNSDALPTGLATVFAPAVAATLFIMLALAIVNCELPLDYCLDCKADPLQGRSTYTALFQSPGANSLSSKPRSGY